LVRMVILRRSDFRMIATDHRKPRIGNTRTANPIVELIRALEMIAREGEEVPGGPRPGLHHLVIGEDLQKIEQPTSPLAWSAAEYESRLRRTMNETRIPGMRYLCRCFIGEVVPVIWNRSAVPYLRRALLHFAEPHSRLLPHRKDRDGVDPGAEIQVRREPDLLQVAAVFRALEHLPDRPPVVL